MDYNVLVPFLQPKHEYVLCISLTPFQKKLYEHYLENFARAGQIGADGKLEGGRKGGLFYDVQNLSRVWNHPYILLKAKVIWYSFMLNTQYRYKKFNLTLPAQNGIWVKFVDKVSFTYRKIASSNTSRLEAHVGFFRLLMKGIFGPYVLWPFDKTLIFLISNAH